MINIQSRIGGRRENQDFYGTVQTQWGQLIVICDGMGGCRGGRHAAETAVNTILHEMTYHTKGNPANALKHSIEKANANIWQESNSNSEYRGMGTTMVALLIMADRAISCNVGDSRIYQLRQGKIVFRTNDHSLVFLKVHAGQMTEEQARVSLDSNIITRALGIRPTVEIDMVKNLTYQPGDRFMLCTDGIWGALLEEDLIAMASQEADIKTAVTQMMEKIDAMGFECGGGHDNMTVGMVSCPETTDFFLSENSSHYPKKCAL